jgi:hypothetical protein
MKKLYWKNDKTNDRKVFTVSSNATKGNFAETLTLIFESIGCFGPDDFIKENVYKYLQWDKFEEMSQEEENERIKFLANEWGLKAEELEYLR